MKTLTTITGPKALVEAVGEIPAGVEAVVLIRDWQGRTTRVVGTTYRRDSRLDSRQSEVGIVTNYGVLAVYSWDYNNLTIHEFHSITWVD
jgi:hypothetical protein